MHKSDEWELSKENIQPLRRGRHMESLQSALQPDSDGEQQRMAMEKQKMEFESELRSYKGDDPLEPWVSYIEWTEQHFPKGGREGSLVQLIEKCISEFVDQPTHKNDERFIDICLKLANMADDCLEFFNFMYGKGIGQTVASFYVQWSHALEAAGNGKKADAVFLKGIRNGAEPISTLELRHKEFLARLMNRSSLEVGAERVGDHDDDRRIPMTSLKTYGKNKAVGTIRTGSAVSNRNQGVASLAAPNSQKGTGIVVCCDEKDYGRPRDGASVGTALLNAESRKENERKPGKWSGGARCGSKVTTPVAQPCLKFDVHKDESPFTLPPETPQIKHVNGNAPLSVKKEKKEGASLFRHGPRMYLVNGGKEVHMFRNDLVYGGVQEFQFEEVRFAIYRRKRKEEESECLQREQSEKLRIMDEKMNAMERKQRQLLDFVMEFFRASGKPTNTETVGKVFKMMGQELTDEEVRDVTHRYNETLHCPEPATEDVPIERDSNAAQTPMKLATLDPASCGLRGTTPTVHTKEAMKIVMGFFDLSAKAKEIASDSNPTTEEQEVRPALQPKGVVTVFEDPVSDDQPPTVRPTATPMIVFKDRTTKTGVENSQNLLPHDHVQVSNKCALAGCLEPSLIMPFEPLREEAESQHEDLGAHSLPQASCFSFTMPTNTLFFSNNAKVVSTPVSSFSSPSSAASISREMAVVVEETTSTCVEAASHVSVSLSVEEIAKQTAQGLPFILRRSLVTHPGETKYLDLSTIAETSRDHKSSSSGSSGTSSAATSHFRSTIFRNKTRGESSAVLDKSEKSRTPPDPFDLNAISALLKQLDNSTVLLDGVTVIDGKLPKITANIFVTIGMDNYMVSSKVGSGAYASVFKANRVVCREGSELNSSKEEEQEDNFVLKVQKPACPWEFYICVTLRCRLKKAYAAVEVMPSIMNISRMYWFDDGSIIETEYHCRGTLLDLVNRYKKLNQTMPEPIALYFTVEILHIVEQIHACQIIHADIKPDNFMFGALPRIDSQTDGVPKLFPNETGSLKLIDYGRSIDMSLFPTGTEFTAKVETECFECIEMKEDRPWTYQIDFFGVAACAHIMLFGKYMVPVKTSNGKWKISSTIRRYWNAGVWHSFFNQLLNIPGSDQLPNVAKLRSSLEECLTSVKDVVREFPKMVKELSDRTR